MSFPLPEAGVSEHVCVGPGSVHGTGPALGIPSRRAVEVRELLLGFWLSEHSSAAAIRR